MQGAVASLIGLHGQIADLIRTARKANLGNEKNVDFVAALRNVVNLEFAGEFETIAWTVETIPRLDEVSGEIILGAAREVIRNAAVHGRGDEPKRLLHLGITIQQTNSLDLVISDDGIGLYSYLVPSKGSGNGLALHSTLLAIIGGHLTADPLSSGGTQVIISVPAQLVILHEPIPENASDTPRN